MQAEFASRLPSSVAALLGLLLGLTSRRLLGDYLAIVTLFFGQAFVVFVGRTANPHIARRGADRRVERDRRRRPARLLRLRGSTSTTQYYFCLLIVFVLAAAALYFLSESRTGRSWRPSARTARRRGDEHSGLRLKLLAFAFGAGMAGLVGCIFAAILTGVVAGNFDVSLLIILYAIVILRRASGASPAHSSARSSSTVILQFLAPQNPTSRSQALALLRRDRAASRAIRPWRRLAVDPRGSSPSGFVAHASWRERSTPVDGGSAVDGPAATRDRRTGCHPADGHAGYDAWSHTSSLVGGDRRSARQLKGWWRTVGLDPDLYWLAVRLGEQPRSRTRGRPPCSCSARS